MFDTRLIGAFFDSLRSILVISVALATLGASSSAQAAHLGADDPVDGEATVSGQPSAPDVSRLDVDYDPAGTVTLTVRFHTPLDQIDTSQNYSFYSNFTLGHAEKGYTPSGRRGYNCVTSAQGDLNGQHHVWSRYNYVFYDQATVTGYDGLLTFSRTTADDKRSIAISASGSVIAGRDYNCATYILRGRRRGPVENINTRYDEACNCWYFARYYDVVGQPRNGVDTSPPLYFDGYAPPPLSACEDGLDNDGDGRIDLDDYGCRTAEGTSEANPACSDGLDNDGDGRIDLDDDDCNYDSYGVSEGEPPTACANRRDDDGDGKTDLNDPGCQGKRQGTTETDPAPVESTFTLKARAIGNCRIVTRVEVLPDLKPAKLFPFAKVHITVARGKSRVTRRLPVSAHPGYVFELREPGRYAVEGFYSGDRFREKSRTIRRRVEVPDSKCHGT